MTRYFLRVADHTIDKESCLPLKMKAFISVQNAGGSDNTWYTASRLPTSRSAGPPSLLCMIEANCYVRGSKIHNQEMVSG